MGELQIAFQNFIQSTKIQGALLSGYKAKDDPEELHKGNDEWAKSYRP